MPAVDSQVTRVKGQQTFGGRPAAAGQRPAVENAGVGQPSIGKQWLAGGLRQLPTRRLRWQGQQGAWIGFGRRPQQSGNESLVEVRRRDRHVSKADETV